MMIMTCFCEMGDQQKYFKPSFQQEMLLKTFTMANL